MRTWITALFVVVGVHGAASQEINRNDPTTSYSVFAAYSNDSSRMILGAAQNRRLFMAGVDYSRKLSGDSIYSWRYQVEVVPVELLQNPELTSTITTTITVQPAGTVITEGGTPYSALQLRQCESGSGSGVFYGAGSNGQPIQIGSYSYSAVCSNPWTFGGGVSPLGQKVNFLPHSRVQPYLAVNAGFVAFANTVPSNTATMFNFSFEFGGGFEWNVRSGQAWALDYRCHHISNAGRGQTNPGVDNGTFRVSYRFSR